MSSPRLDLHRGWRCSARLFFIFALLAIANARSAFAQSNSGIPMDVVIIWIEGHVSPQRVWKTDIEKKGLSFAIDEAAERQLRGAGATDEWIQMLRGSKSTILATTQTTPPRQVLQPTNPTTQRHFSRAQLMPLYYERQVRFETYVSVAHLQETGGAVNGQRMQTANGSILLESVPLSTSAITYGVVVGSPNVALDVEGYFHQPNLMMINMGIAFDEFLPLATTGLRGIVGVTPFIGDTRQIIGHTPRAASDTSDNAVELHNAVYGGDARAGLAYHWRPGKWIYVEGHYRIAATARRELVIPHQSSLTDGLPWSKWAAHGGMLRVGLGW